MKSFGSPDVLELTDEPDPKVTPARTLVNVTRAGVNYADVHVRNDTYLAPVATPYIPGNEVVGVTEDGRRIAGLVQGGGYAEKAAVRNNQYWEIPDTVDDDQAIAVALQGNTAYHLLFSQLQIRANETVLIPAAAGGVGSLAVQLAAANGTKVIAMASTEEKRQLALDLGAKAVVDSSTEEDLAQRINAAAQEANGNRRDGINAALEMTGASLFATTLDVMQRNGRVATFGYASGIWPSLKSEDLLQTLLKKSLTVSGFWLPNVDATHQAFSTKSLFTMITQGQLRIINGGTYALGDAAQAHRDLASRTVTGKLSLDPSR
ncbi:zinc-binding dehydrogenase [Streptomyces sp. NBC_01433]|uniref:quinone oxidoreductase family protein n=1 Tax=Streptomyces sp. NBC_01433 TaxID=2903864 RepID=UPI002B1CD73B|nr:zinc-binding dehydrogenase [Streptomyces sp. NBC_01433]